MLHGATRRVIFRFGFERADSVATDLAGPLKKRGVPYEAQENRHCSGSRRQSRQRKILYRSSTERGKSNAQKNALQHSILAKKVVLETEEERAEFQELLQTCKDDLGLEGLLGELFAEEIATQIWKLQIVLGLETRELASRQEERDGVDGVFHGDLHLPISDWDLPIDKGWACERIVVRAVAGKDQRTANAQRGPAIYQGQILKAIQRSQNNDSQEAGHLEVEAVLGSTFEKMTRYQSTVKRDLYRAIDKARELQRERREREKGEGG